MLLSQVFIYVKAHMHINLHTKFQLGFLKFQIFNGRKGQEGRSASVCQISSNSLELRPRYGDFSIFKMAAAAILDFQNLKFLTFWTVKRVELRNCAKFCRNRSNHGRDIVIFRFSKMAAAAILDFQNLKFFTFETVKRVELRNHAKFCLNRSNCGRDIVI